mgnify:CR=1|tara:strand:+ start:8403 stop:8780 length:378 start_codon:yes stop_codon:yes gene_type:complete
MSNPERPLSPHLSIYRWPVTMTVSILHRVTGVALSVGFVVFCLWLFDAAAGASAYNSFMSYAESWPGQLLLIGWSFAFFFHLANGVRHLVWDTGRGLEIAAANASAWFVIVLSTLLTVLFWWGRL